jgi:hypothetical protein
VTTNIDIAKFKAAMENRSIITGIDLHEYLVTENPSLKESAYRWTIWELIQAGVIHRISRNRYGLGASDLLLPTYATFLSDEAQQVLSFCEEKYPLLDFIVWESRGLNEFANHQLVRNFIFVESEKTADEDVFENLRQALDFTVLYRPNAKEINLYSSDTTVIVQTLTSEAPIKNHSTCIEKLLVDLFANKLLNAIISPGERDGIYADAFGKYHINESILLRYARRRNKYDDVSAAIARIDTITEGK